MASPAVHINGDSISKSIVAWIVEAFSPLFAVGRCAEETQLSCVKHEQRQLVHRLKNQKLSHPPHVGRRARDDSLRDTSVCYRSTGKAILVSGVQLSP